MAKIKRLSLWLMMIILAVYGGNFILRYFYPLNYYEVIRENTAKYSLDPLLIAAVINTESRFCEDATSHKDAKGLMQIREETALWCAEQIGITDYTPDKIYQPKVNITLGVWYIDYLLDEFDQDLTLTLAAYNAGMGNVRKWQNNINYSKDGRNLDKIPFPETERYIKKVKNNHAIYKMLY